LHETTKSSEIMAETLLDLRGLKCPLPALKTRKALSRIAPGEVLVVECTDPMAAIDIPHLVGQTKDALEEQSRADDILVFRIRKAKTGKQAGAA
jgi:tRNA 2-thiouridine synthesizing protein A